MHRSRQTRRWFSLALAVLAVTHVVARGRGDEIHVMVSGGFTPAYKILASEWEKATGNTIATVFGASMGETPTAIPNRLAHGEPADVVILARPALDGLAGAGRVVEGSQVDLARSRIGMAVKAGAPVPDISTESRFRQVLLDAQSIAYSDSASGVYISTELFKKLGIEAQVAGKARKIPGRPVGEVVAAGEAAIGFQQMSELMAVEGITVVGPIPDSVQLITTFSAGVSSTARSADASRQLIAYLSSRDAWPTIRKTGLDPITAGAEVRLPVSEVRSYFPGVIRQFGSATWSGFSIWLLTRATPSISHTTMRPSTGC